MSVAVPARSETHDTDLLRRYADTRDPALRDELTRRYLRLAGSVARRFRGRADDDDLEQVAAIGLLKAIDRFDPDRGRAFSSFAVPTISGELKRHLRDRTWAVRPPRDVLELSLRVERAAQRLNDEHGRQPTVEEIASSLGPETDVEHVLEALHARQGKHSTSLQSPFGGDPEAATLEDVLGEEEHGLAVAEDRVMASRLLRAVSPRERRVLMLRFVEDRTQAEIGTELGVSQMQVSRILRGALQRMREVAGA